MKKWLILLIIIFQNVQTVYAVEYTAPEAPASAEIYMPDETESFSDGLFYVLKEALFRFRPDVAEAVTLCLRLIVVMLLIAILKNFYSSSKAIVNLVSVLCISIMLIQSTNSLIQLGIDTVSEISEYGKLLLPVMTATLAAQGGINSSAALYTGTAFFSSILSTLIGRLIIPLMYFYMVLCIGYRAVGEDILKNLRDFLKWLIVWSIKIVLYIFTGYLTITGVVSGTTDAAALKATKLTISGVVPVVGGIISDASDTILVSAGIVKNAAGIYGLLAILAIWIGPFLKIGVQYLLLKAAGGLCGGIAGDTTSGLIKDFSGIMGILVAMTGTICLLFLVSIVCYLRGVA